MTKTLKTLILILTSLAALVPASLAQQASPVAARLVIPDGKVLPGVPFEMWIELQNRSDATVAVGMYPCLLVRPEGGKDFEVSPVDSHRTFPVLLKSAALEGNGSIGFLVLAPGSHKTLTLPIYHGDQFFEDPRISPPGRYTLAIRLDAFPNGMLDIGPTPLTFLGSVVTSESAIERVQPEGSDAKVWQRMQEIGNGHWSVKNHCCPN